MEANTKLKEQSALKYSITFLLGVTHVCTVLLLTGIAMLQSMRDPAVIEFKTFNDHPRTYLAIMTLDRPAVSQPQCSQICKYTWKYGIRVPEDQDNAAKRSSVPALKKRTTMRTTMKTTRSL